MMLPANKPLGSASPIRLVSFLGTSPYKETTYSWRTEAGVQTHRTRFVTHALAEMAPASEVVILATKEAWEKNGCELAAVLGGLSVSLKTPDQQGFFPSGGSEEELWQQFERIKNALRAERGTKIFLDITHGFRSQPFFAAAAIAFTRMVDPNPPDLQVVYGAFEAGKGTDDATRMTPIWDVTPTVELLDWSRHLMLFLRTGRAEELAGEVAPLGKALQKTWHAEGRRGPGIDQIAKALNRFGEDLETVRTGSLLLGKPGEGSSVSRLLEELDRAREPLVANIPPLADVLDRIIKTVEPLHTDNRLSEPDGQRALKALASLYLDMGRYAEAAATIREAWITRYANSQADCPGHSDFSDEHRKAAETAWYEANKLLAQEIGQTRNDIQHGGYKQDLQPATTIKRKIRELIGNFIPKTHGNA